MTSEQPPSADDAKASGVPKPPTAHTDSLDPESELEIQIGAVEAKLKRLTGASLSLIYLFVAATSLAGVLILAVPAISDAFSIPSHSRGMLGGVLLMYGAFGGLAVALLRQGRIARVEAELEPLYARRRVLLRLSGQSSSPSAPEPSYFDRLVTINVENLAAYYTLVKVQTDKSFTTSVAAGIVGFAFVLAGLMIAFSDVRNSDRVAYISTGAGIVTEFIASVFFYLYNRTVRQMKGYHDSLLSVQNVLLSFKLVGDIKTDDAEKVKMVGQMLSYLMGKKPEAIGGTAVEIQPKA